MKNVTVTLDDETVRWVRIEAARRDESVSSLLRNLLREHMGGRAAQASACTGLLTEDLQHGLEIDGLVIADPFRTPVGSLS
jgi:hypothetical protein